MQNQRINPEEAYQTMMIVWLALLVSQFIFVGIAFFLRPDLLKFDFTKPVLGDGSIVVLALAAVSIVDFALSFIMRRKYLARSVSEQSSAIVQTAMIIGCALAEAISLFGLLLAFAFNYQYFFLFSALGVIAIILHRPRRDDVHAASFKV